MEAKTMVGTAVSAVKRIIRALTPDRFTRADHVNLSYRVTPVDGTEMSDLLNPAYWVHFASTLRRFDRIIAVPDDEGWYAEYIVLETGTGYARTAILHYIIIDADGEALSDASPVEVKFKGPYLKHVVIRKSDNHILVDKIAKRTEAEDWARDYESRVGA